MRKVKVSAEIVAAAYGHFIEVFHKETLGQPHGMQFWAFIGVKDAHEFGLVGGSDYWCLPTVAARCAEMLASPHYRAVAKAMQACGHRPDSDLLEKK